MNITEKIDNYLNEKVGDFVESKKGRIVTPEKMEKEGFEKSDGEWYIHPSYEGFKFKIRNGKLSAKDPKGGWDTTDNISQMKNTLKNYKK